MNTGNLHYPSSRFRMECDRRAVPPSPSKDDALVGLIEEVRQLRAAVSVYRHVVERLQKQHNQ
jgi:hypothetical protein